MKGKIIQKGTGYCVGEINEDSITINIEHIGDPEFLFSEKHI